MQITILEGIAPQTFNIQHSHAPLVWALQVVDVPSTVEGEPRLAYDPEWLAIMRANHSLLSTNRGNVRLPGMGAPKAMKLKPHQAWVCLPRDTRHSDFASAPQTKAAVENHLRLNRVCFNAPLSLSCSAQNSSERLEFYTASCNGEATCRIAANVELPGTWVVTANSLQSLVGR